MKRKLFLPLVVLSFLILASSVFAAERQTKTSIDPGWGITPAYTTYWTDVYVYFDGSVSYETFDLGWTLTYTDISWFVDNYGVSWDSYNLMDVVVYENITFIIYYDDTYENITNIFAIYPNMYLIY